MGIEKDDSALRAQPKTAELPHQAPTSDTPVPSKPLGKIRQCWNCGADMGFIENRYYDRRDTCGARECDNEARNAEYCERHEAHEQLDRDRGWDT